MVTDDLFFIRIITKIRFKQYIYIYIYIIRQTNRQAAGRAGRQPPEDSCLALQLYLVFHVCIPHVKCLPCLQKSNNKKCIVKCLCFDHWRVPGCHLVAVVVVVAVVAVVVVVVVIVVIVVGSRSSSLRSCWACFRTYCSQKGNQEGSQEVLAGRL